MEWWLQYEVHFAMYIGSNGSAILQILIASLLSAGVLHCRFTNTLY